MAAHSVAAKNWRDVGLEALIATRLLHLLQRLTRQRGVVLLYHSVADGQKNPYLSSAAYRAQMEMLRAEFRVIGGPEFLWYLQRRQPPPRNSVLITFDDGYKNNRTVVQPIMEQLQLPWVLFSTTQGINRPGSYLWMTQLRGICQFLSSDELSFAGRRWSLGTDRSAAYKRIARWSSMQPASDVERATQELIERCGSVIPGDYLAHFCALMDADDLHALGASSLVEIAAHTHSHPYLTQLTADRLGGEIEQPRHLLEDASGKPVRMFAYPSGRYGRREIEHVAAAGFACAFAVIPEVGRGPDFEVPRIGVYSTSVTALRAKCLGAASMLRAARVRVG